MRVAVYAADVDERYALSRFLDDELLRYGILPEMMLFPMQTELFEEFTDNNKSFDIAVITEPSDKAFLKALCNYTQVILIGGKSEGPMAFDVGAAYFVEKPIDRTKINKALARCI